MAELISLHDRQETNLLLEYCFKHKIVTKMTTTNGKSVEVIDPGLHNRNNGPDFFNAKVRIDNTLWVGNIEVIGKSSEWKENNYDKDMNYDNVILVICGEFNSFVQNSLGETLNVVCQTIPENIINNYHDLMENSECNHPACYKIIPSLSSLKVHAWLAAMETERLENQTESIRAIAENNNSWEKAYFVTMARAFGFSYNSDTYKKWAESIPLNSLEYHRDDLFQIEAVFLGQAGLLNLDMIPEKYQHTALNEGYFAKLRNEYLYLTHKYSLKPIDPKEWNFQGLRPQNYPHIRLSQMANLYYQRKATMEIITGCENIKEVKDQLSIRATPYWQSHYTFGALEKKQKEKFLSQSSINTLIINVVIPFLYTYGRHENKEILCDYAFDYIEQIKAENNTITKQWERVGIKVKTAGESQALIQMKHQYCNKKDCLRCRFGHEYMIQS